MAVSEQMLTSVRSGILPLTSACNTACAFCSHRFNPPEVNTRAVQPLSQADLHQLLPTISDLTSLTIGEAASTIMEGEPLTHPAFAQIMQQIRAVATELPIKLTTNGILLSDQLLAFLESIQPIELTISLNSSTRQGRAQLMGIHAGTAEDLLKRLATTKIPWQGSLVAMPQLVGVQDVLDTLQAAAKHGAETIRVFLPGFTRLTPERLRLPDATRDELLWALDEWADSHPTPLLVEPRRLQDLRAEIAGVIAGSPADGRLSRHDVILRVNGSAVVSRVDAFERLYEAVDPAVTFERGGQLMHTNLPKAAGSRSGIVVSGDLSPALIRRLHRRCAKWRSVWVLVSALGGDLIRACLSRAQFPGVEVITVNNSTFGGSIGCAGLLTTTDLIASMPANNNRPDLLLLPKVAFDQSGRDITGVHYHRVQAAAGYRVELL